MKARLKSTGEIVEVAYHGLGVYVDMNKWDEEYNFDEIIILDNGDPDYWTRLEHQYAGMAMQGLVTRGEVLGSSVQEIARDIADISCEIAHALVEKMKEKEE